MVDREDEVVSRDPSEERAELRRSIKTEASDVRRVASAAAAASPDEDNEMELKYGAEHVIRLFVPVSICMAVVVVTMKTVEYYSTDSDKDDVVKSSTYAPFKTTEEDDTSTRLFSSIGNALIILASVVVMTFLLILLYKYECYKVIHGWLIFSSFLILSLFASLYVSEVLKTNNWCVSMPTVLIGMFNFTAMGLICIHWKGPLLLQQAYLIAVSALMALWWIKMLPDWTVWPLLVVIAVWDLIAVLCPKGPLNMLVKLSQERNEPIFPALIYSSGILLPYTIGVAGKRKEKEGGRLRAGAEGAANGEVSPSTDTTEESGVKLGLGDFIFYSILMGTAVKNGGDWNVILACYIAILMGLCGTLVLLAAFKKALPALPISIAAGLIFYFCTTFLITPFTTRLVTHQLIY